LSGIVIYELRWRVCVESFQDFRSEIRRDFGLKLREEIHASEMLLRPGVSELLALLVLHESWEPRLGKEEV
jgi:hypothetical protein